MEKLPKSQLAKVALFFLLLLLTPFVSTSLRPSYIYFLFNVLIIALSIDAGLFSAISGPRHEEKRPIAVAAPVAQQSTPHNGGSSTNGGVTSTTNQLHEGYVQPALNPAGEKPRPKVEKAAVAATTRAVQKALKRCPSRPSIFFIGGGEGEAAGVAKEEKVTEEEEEKKFEFEFEVVGELSKQELFTKAESFIGNFYKQLKMQREESWKKIHGLYHRPF